MILYSLTCEKDHGFESWFRDSAAYDAARKGRRVDCPVCGSKRISKAPMAPRLSSNRSAPNSQEAGGRRGPSQPLAELLSEVRRHVETHCDYVGDRFADEARRIHYKEAEPRNIYGEASADEAKELIDEGVDVAPLPILPKKKAN